MINILFFAQVRERLGTAQMSLEFEPQLATAEALRAYLASQNDNWARVMANDNLLVAVNQTMSHWGAPIADGDEVAFFPPVTGG